MIRPTGEYAVVDGAQHPVSGRGRDYVNVEMPHGRTRCAIDDLDDLVKVVTTATWRGGRIYVSAVTDDACGFFTDDRALAGAEGLRGDQHSGWTGTAPLDELSQVDERVSPIHPRRRPT